MGASKPRAAELAIGVALVLSANAPLFLVAYPFSGLEAIGVGDARTHAVVVRALADGGASHGWTDSLLAGFPLGPHYPMLAWTLSAVLAKAGLEPQAAVDTVGLLATLATPLLAFTLAVRAGYRFLPSLMGALFLSWLAPSNMFTGGYEAFYVQGLISQVLVAPLALATADRIARSRSPWHVTLLAALMATCHPQVLVGLFAVLFVPVAASANGRVVWNYVRGGLAGALVAAALYVPGIRTLHVPFGWPPMAPWKVTGFGPDHLAAWYLNGELFDSSRAPVLTVMAALAVAFGAASLRAPAVRAALLAVLSSVGLSVSGNGLRHLGRTGQFLTSFLQPLRILSLVPLAVACLIVVAFHETIESLEGAGARHDAILGLRGAVRSRARPLLLALPMAVVATVAVSERLAWARSWNASIAMVRGASGPCRLGVTGGAVPTTSGDWWTRLSGGRLWYDENSLRSLMCAVGTGFEVASSVPLAATDSVGTQVGVHAAAFRALSPELPGSASRAEALGIRHALLDDRQPVGEGWDLVAHAPPLELVKRHGGTNIVGVGCIESVLSGRDSEVRSYLFEELARATGASHLLDPTHLVGLESTDAPVGEAPVDPQGCDASSARVTEAPREPGRYEATVENPSPVDLVVRAAAFPSWEVEVDGKPARVTKLAVGFFSTRLTPGVHHVVAVVGLLPHYVLGVMLALLGALVCSVTRPNRAPKPEAVPLE